MAKKAIIKVYDGTQWVELDLGGSVEGVTTDDIEHAASGDSLSSFLDGLSYRLDVLESNGGGSSGSSSCNQYYGTCSTGSSTTAKVVVCEGFALTKGARISVRFSSYNTATSPTLNVNSTGAKAIKEYGTTASYMSYRWPSGGVVGFVYDGTYWIMEQPRTATTTYYGLSRCDRVTLNGSTTSSPSFYAPTSAGTSGQILVSNGSGAPKWSALPDADNLYLTSGESIEEAIDSMDTKISNLEQNGGSSGGSGGSSTFAYLTESDIMVDEVINISSYLSNYNELMIYITINCDDSIRFGLCTSSGVMSGCSLSTDSYCSGVLHFYKSSNNNNGLWVIQADTISTQNTNNACTVTSYTSGHTYIGNTAVAQGTSVEMNIVVYGR